MTQPAAPSTVLVVEDDPATGEFFAELLESEGYTIILADCGQAALHALKAQTVQIVLLDRRLPDMDGLAVCREMRAIAGHDFPIMLLTADHASGLGTEAKEAGVNAFLAKPFDTDVLLERMSALIAGSPAGATNGE